MMPSTTNENWTLDQQQSFELAQMVQIAKQENSIALDDYMHRLSNAMQTGDPINSVLPAQLVTVVPNTDKSNPVASYMIANSSTFSAPQPPAPQIDLTASPVGALVPMTTNVYSAVPGVISQYGNGAQVTEKRGTFLLSANNTPWGMSYSWSLIKPASN